MASHNSKYYVKAIRKKDSTKCQKIETFFKSSTLNLKGKCDEVQNPDEIQVVSEDVTADHDGHSCDVSQCDSEILDKISDEETDNNSDHDVSLCDRRTFDTSRYENTFKWLYWNSSKKGYICKYCELFNSSNSKTKWVNEGVLLGCHPTRKLAKHDCSDAHINSCDKYAVANTSLHRKSKLSVYQKLVEKDKEDRERNREILKKLFKIAYFIVRKRWAQTNFHDMVIFIASLGVEDLQHHMNYAPSNATYLSDASVTELIEIIGDYIERRLIASLRQANFFTLLADESTDEQNREQLSIFGRWVYSAREPTASQDHFLGIMNVPKTDSRTLLQAIQQFLLAKNVDVSRCRFVGFDGTNAMSGEISGLQRRMRNLSPMLLYMNCRNHRLALCLKHLMKQYPLLVEADEILLAVWKIFHFSPRRFEVFKNIQEVYGQQPLNVIRAATTRWLSHGQACVRFIDRYQAILDTLDALYDERKEPEVFGLRASIARKNVVAMILLLCDVLRPVNLLSLYLQDPKICFVDIEAKVKATTNELENLINSLQAPNFTQNDDIYFSKVVGLFQEIDDRTALNRRLRPQGADGNLTPDSFIQTIGVPFIYSLIGEMTDAFNCHPVFQAFRALDPRCVPQHADDLTDFGKADIETLARHYGMAKEDTFQGHVTRCEADIDNIDILKREYIGFKHQMFMLRQTGECHTPQDLLNSLGRNDALRTCFPRISQLIELMNIVPTSTASVERSFSSMNGLCTPLRSSLGQAHLSSLMMMCLEGPEELSDDCLAALVDTFRQKKTRKLAL